MSIADLFETEGEAAFRERERQVAVELSGSRGCVIATGGRLMLDAANAEALGATGPVFCLTAAPAEIVERVARQAGTRPLLAVPDPAERVRRLLQERAAGYGRFPQIPTSRRSPADTAAQILALLDHDVLGVVHPAGQYNVIVGEGLLPRLRQVAALDGSFVVITDSNVAPLHAQQLGRDVPVLTMPAGEQHKTLRVVQQLHESLAQHGADRQTTIVALGGGVVGDVAGFVAATYMRGVRLVQCPTSLLAMVDASVGGKTGVDLPQGKNLVGAFKQPLAVVADLETLDTLPLVELQAGMAEVVKSGLIADPQLFAQLEQEAWSAENAQARHHWVTASIRVKRNIVEADPFESGRRAVLNLGHTFGHGLERVTEYRIRHGEAVAIGLVAAARLSAALGYCDPQLISRITAVLERIGLPVTFPADVSAIDLYAAMGSDKKKAAGRLRFILLRDAGDVFIAGDVPQAAVLDSLRATGAA